MNKQRPINLDLTKIHFPITAISSILHRISGVIIFIIVGFLIWLLGLSLSSLEGFNQVIIITHNMFFKYINLIIVTVIFFHIISGIRHILIDFNYLPETFNMGISSAKWIFAITIIFFILYGILLIW